MTALLDTHPFLWWLSGDPRLSATARKRIEDTSETLLFSIASVWEIAIKASLGKLQLPEPPAVFIKTRLERHGIYLLAITIDHAGHVFELPHHHRDPFDRLLLAQALVERVPLITADATLGRYGAELIW